MKKIDIKFIVYKDGKLWTSRCLNAEVASCGRTKKEAIKMLHEAVELYFDDSPVPEVLPMKNPDLMSMSLSLQHA